MANGKKPKTSVSMPRRNCLVSTIANPPSKSTDLFLGSEEPGPESSGTSEPDIDPDDPMRDYLLQKWREERAGKKAKKAKSKGKHRNETPEERRARKERKREKKAMREVTKSEGLKGVEALLRSLDNPRR